MELLLGCGSKRDKRVFADGKSQWENLVTLDHNADHKPDVVWNLDLTPLPFETEACDEIHAYEVLEHLGTGQGDWRSWFAEWSEWYRLLKPNGLFCATCPSLNSRWLWGDPSHRRVVQRESLEFLSQQAYTDQIGKTSMSDFRFVFKADFELEFAEDKGDHFIFVLRAVKPSRISL